MHPQKRGRYNQQSSCASDAKHAAYADPGRADPEAEDPCGSVNGDSAKPREFTESKPPAKVDKSGQDQAGLNAVRRSLPLRNDTLLILSLDGGGSRGAISAELLRLIEKHLQVSIHETCDFFTGVSTGAIIACYCASNIDDMEFLSSNVYSPANLANVFDKSIWDKLLGRMQNQPKYDGINKTEHFARLFGDTRLSDVRRKRLMVLAYDFINREITVFKNDRSLYNPTLKEVCDAATAAPTLYPPVGTSEPRCRWLIDGAVATNDPGMIAVAEAMAQGYALENIWMLSLGTGKPVHDLNQRQQATIGKKAKGWGVVEWIANGLFDHMMMGSSSVSEYQCQQLLGDRYLRVNGYLPRPLLQLDNTDRDSLLELKSQAFEWFEEHCDAISSLLERAKHSQAQTVLKS
ncbi:MAG: patatin-like phospholipase family protein [Pseudomonadota bacterium]